MSGADGEFGPGGPARAGGPPFTVAGPSTVVLDAARSGSASFTVSNLSGRPVRTRVLVLPGSGADASWFEVRGESERSLPVAGTATIDVAVALAKQAPAGSFTFTVGAALEESPDQVVPGPTVTFQASEPKQRKFPWWIVIVAAAALVLLIGGGILIWSLIPRPESTPTPSPIPTISPSPTVTVLPTPLPSPTAEVLVSDSYNVSMYSSLDVETGQPEAPADPQSAPMDISFYDSDVLQYGMSGTADLWVNSRYSATALIGTADVEKCIPALKGLDTGWRFIPDGDEPAFVCLITNEGHYAVVEIAPQQLAIGSRLIAVTVWDGAPT